MIRRSVFAGRGIAGETGSRRRSPARSCRFVAVLAGVAFVLACPRAMAANAVANGDFSANAALFTTFPGYVGGANPAVIANWTHAGNCGINGTGISTPFGPASQALANYYAFIQGAGGSLSQAIPLLPNTTYFIGFLAANRASNATAAGRVRIADSSTTYYDSGVTVWGTAAFALRTATFTTPNLTDGTITITLSNASPGGDNTVCYSDVSIDPVLFYDDCDVARSASLTSPKGRATGAIRSAVTYVWTSTTDVEIDGTLDWDANGDKNGQNQQPAANGTQSLRLSADLAPYVAGKVWDVEFDQRVAWSHPLTFGLSDNAQNGNWAAWDDGNYDFAAGQYGTALRYDADNEAGGGGAVSVDGVFPTPPTLSFHHFRIRFDEPNRTATVWIDGNQKAQVTTLDFENAGRYLSWGEPTDYAGALDNIKVSLVFGPPPDIVLSNLAATGISTNSATLNATVSAPTTNADVAVYWGPTDGGKVVAAWSNSIALGSWTNVATTNVSYTPGRLDADTLYYYAFGATNRDAVAWSGTRTFSTLFAAAQTPVFIGATARASVRVALSWQDRSATETAYLLLRSDSGAAGPYAQVAMLPANTTNYVDVVRPQAVLFYRLSAINSVSQGSTDPRACQIGVMTPAEPPARFLEDFESPAVAGYAQGTLPESGKWVGANQGYNSTLRGLCNKDGGDFAAPDPNRQTFAFRYTNSGITTSAGAIGYLVAGRTYTISFDVVRDQNTATHLPYTCALIAFADGAARNDCRSTPAGSRVLASRSGNAPADGSFERVTFQYSADPEADAADLGKDLGLRFYGATVSASIDHVAVTDDYRLTPPGTTLIVR